MAQLTLLQKASMRNNAVFHQRMESAFKRAALLWRAAPTTTVASFNRAMQKRKAFANKILNDTAQISVATYVTYFLSEYVKDPPVLINNPAQPDHEQLTDAELVDTDSNSAAYKTFDFFAGVIAGDDTRGLEY